MSVGFFEPGFHLQGEFSTSIGNCVYRTVSCRGRCMPLAAYPLVYLCRVPIRGPFTGRYSYSFRDEQLGGAMTHAVVVTIAFLALGELFVFVD